MNTLKFTTKTFGMVMAIVVSINLCLQAADANNYGANDRAGVKKDMSYGNRGIAGSLCSLKKLDGVDVVNSASMIGRPRIGTDMNSTRPDMDRDTTNRNRRTGVDETNRRMQQNEKLGTVDEILLDTQKKVVAYVVVEADGKYYPIPWTAFDKSHFKAYGSRMGATDRRGSITDANTKGSRAWWKDNNHLMINMDKTRFQQAPNMESFDINLLDDSAFRARIDSYYSAAGRAGIGMPGMNGKDMNDMNDMNGRTGTGTMQQMELVKASDIIDAKVQNTAKEDLAEIEDVIADSKRGILAYAIVNYGGVLGVGGKYAAVPWSALEFEADNDIAILNATVEQLNGVIVEKDNLDQLSQRQFGQRVHQAFNVEPYWEMSGFKSDSNDMGTWNRDRNDNMNKDNKTKRNSTY